MAGKKKSSKKAAPSAASDPKKSPNNEQSENSFGALLVQKTLRRRPKYDHMLTAADIGTLAPHYKLLLGPDDVFHVVGSKRQLEELLDGYRDNDRKGVMCLILHHPPLHWATMVVSGTEVYFTDSLNYDIPDEYKEAVDERPELHWNDYKWEQQTDGHNCGFWSLMNAEAIRRQIQECDPSFVCFPCVLPSVSPGWHVRYFIQLRRDMARKVRANDTDGDNRDVVVQDDDEPSSSSPPPPAAKAPAAARQRKAKTRAAERLKMQRSHDSLPEVVGVKESGKRKKEFTEETPKKRRKVQKEKVQVASSEAGGPSSDLQCKICLKTFVKSRQLAGHMRCHKPLSFQCEFCSYRTNRRPDLDGHVRSMHPDPESRHSGLHECPTCKKKYVFPKALKNHMEKCF